MIRHLCECGISCPVAAYPVQCACGRVHTGPSKLSKSRGLGDTVAKITGTLGIEPCNGCEQRQEFLNKMFPYSPEYLAEQEQVTREKREDDA